MHDCKARTEMPRITSADHGDTMLVHGVTVDLRVEMKSDDRWETTSAKQIRRRTGREGEDGTTRTEWIRTRIPTLMAAYTHAKLRAMGSFEALKSATDSVPIRIDMLRYETHAETAR